MPRLACLALVATLLIPLTALAQHDPAAPCGRDVMGNALPCHSVSPQMLEATCTTRADPAYCLPYHQRACQVSGFAQACALASLGQNCWGGDPARCQYYVQLLQANTDCQLNGNPAACNWLAQQRY